MRSSRWDAQGNIYLVTEEPQTPESVRAGVGDADGVLEVLGHRDDALEIVIWNPDGSQAEMSGNGTRIAARWLAELTGATQVTVRVGAREVAARLLPDGRIEQDLGDVAVSATGGGRGHPLHRRRRRESSRGRRRVTQATCCRSGRCSRRMSASRGERTFRSRACAVAESSRRASGNAARGRRRRRERVPSPSPRPSVSRRPSFAFPVGSSTCGSKEPGRF